MSAAETQRWHGFAAGAGVWRRNGGEAERGVVWKQQKAPPGQTTFLRFLFSGAILRYSKFLNFFLQPLLNFFTIVFNIISCNLKSQGP